MDDNVVVVRFADDSQAYEAVSELTKLDVDDRVDIRAAALLTRSGNGTISVPEKTDKIAGLLVPSGGMIGMLVGVLGGPIGMLLGGSIGALAGGVGEMRRAGERDVALGFIAKEVAPGSTVIVAQVIESAEEVIDSAMEVLGGTVVRRPTADVAAEIEAAEEATRAAEQEARRVLGEHGRKERSDS